MASKLGDRAAEALASFVGSWPFIITQTLGIALWVVVNITAFIQHWDPYPFILLNLLFSVQAAYTGPIIMIAQNRQEALQRKQDLYMLHIMEAVKTMLEGQVKEVDAQQPYASPVLEEHVRDNEPTS